MSENLRILPIRCRFADPALERQYRAFLLDRHHGNEVTWVLGGVFTFLAFAPLDLIALQEPILIVLARIGAVVASIGLVVALGKQGTARHFETIAMLMMVVAGSVINFAIWREPDLENTYFVGLIVVAIFISILWRGGFIKSLFGLSYLYCGYLLAVSNKADVEGERIVVQLFFLTCIIGLCVFGFLLLERLRRRDYLKTRTIEQQNAQLSRLLASARIDNQRKVAALNMLLHVIKTPIHQISGFTDLFLSQLGDEEAPEKIDDCIANAKYIKDASDALQSSVSKLLGYHRLDEAERTLDPETLSIGEALSDATAILDDKIRVTITRAVKRIHIDKRLFDAAILNIVSNVEQNATKISALEISVDETENSIIFVFKDDGPGMPEEAFRSAVKPLTEIDNYLSGDGSSPRMGLRTVARAMEISGGAFTYEYADGAIFTLTFPKTQRARTGETTEAA